ncbi:MAG TPA: gamma-glutamyl-gamma-aminobutyrate hydrolase family protein [Acidobacteriaceae bacterium]|jgi:putative glutamine amidotransferase|nr:gamma-glutamyl-gamma-aminobutyrate hydrolase family protein [Acidobacteriaceae bacterium]
MSKPRIAIPIPTSFDPEYNERSWPQYAKAVERSGGEPVPVPLDDPAQAERLAKSCDGVLLPGSGADVEPARFGQERDPNTANADPQREQVDTLLLQTAEQQSKPVLAICFGTQMLNVWRGGSLVQHLPEAPVNHRQKGVAEAHQAEVAPDSLLASAAGLNGRPRPGVFHVEHSGNGAARIAVNSSHHQSIASPGNGLRIAAQSTDDGVIEAIEDAGGKQFLLGVQWHPERTYDESCESKAIFDRFIAEAASRSAKP